MKSSFLYLGLSKTAKLFLGLFKLVLDLMVYAFFGLIYNVFRFSSFVSSGIVPSTLSSTSDSNFGTLNLSGAVLYFIEGPNREGEDGGTTWLIGLTLGVSGYILT